MEPADSSHSLKRVLGAGDLVMLAIGAVIGAGIFGAIGTAAAGQVGPDGVVMRYGAGPALVFSFLLLGAVCALAALCYAELAAMIPQAGSAYAYAYATLGELVAWIIGWDLILEYAVGNVAVAISWGDYFNTLLRGLGVELPAWLTTGYRTALLSSNPDVNGLLNTAPHLLGLPILVNLPAFAIVMAITWLLLRGARESSTANNVMVVVKLVALALFVGVGLMALDHRQLHALRAQRLHRRASGRGDRVLRLHRLRRDFDGRRRNPQPAAQSADRHPGRPGRVHGHLRGGRARCLTGMVPVRTSWPWPIRCPGRSSWRATAASAGWWRLAPPCRCRRCCWCSSTASRASSTPWRATGCCPPGPRGWIPRPACLMPRRWSPAIVVALASLVGDAAETYDLTNIGTLFAFALVCAGVLVLRVVEPHRPRPFRVPAVWVVAPLGIAACVFVMAGLPYQAWERFGIWLVVGVACYAVYGYRHSRLRG